MHSFSQYIIGHISRLIAHPVYNFTSIAVILCSIFLLAIPSIGNLSLAQVAFLKQWDLALLAMIALESILRLSSWQRSRYLRSLALPVDILTILPLPVWFIGQLLLDAGMMDPRLAQGLESLPGILLFKGIRSLRLLNAIRYFHRQRQLGLIDPDSLSPLKARFFTGMASLAFIIVLLIGIGIAIQLSIILDANRVHRKQQISMQARSYGVLQARLVFEKFIPGVYITRSGQRLFIQGTLADLSTLRSHYKLHQDYEQIDEINPGESILISYRDLSRSQHQIELLILLVGICVISAMLISLNRFLNQLILVPIERATRVVELRIAGEELETSDIAQEPFTEIVRMINMQDRIYQKMRAPARTLLTSDAGRKTDHQHPEQQETSAYEQLHAQEPFT